MANEVTLNAGTGGAEIITETIGGTQEMPVSKIHVGDANQDGGPVTITNQFPTYAHGKLWSSAYPLAQVPYGTASLNLDDYNNLMTRGTILTDEGSISDDFDALSLPLSGTITFTNGSDQVTGALSFFVTEGDIYKYIKLDADDETSWAQISSIEDDSHLTLANAYTGTGGAGPASSTYWVTHIGTGGSITCVNSEVLISGGTDSTQYTSIFHQADYSPMYLIQRAKVSQRILNEEVRIAFTNNPSAPTINACFVFSGVDAKSVITRVSSSGMTGSLEDVPLPIPNGDLSSSYHLYEVRLMGDVVYFFIDDIKIGDARKVHVPKGEQVLGIVAGVYHTGGAVTDTVLTLDTVRLNNNDRVDITINQGDSSKLQATVVGPDRVGQTVSLQPTGSGLMDPYGKLQWARQDVAGNTAVSIKDPVTGFGANVIPSAGYSRLAVTLTGDEIFGVLSDTKDLLDDIRERLWVMPDAETVVQQPPVTNTTRAMAVRAVGGIRILDTTGVYTLPSMDAIARRGFVQLTDGTGVTPAMDTVARRAYIQLTDGTSAVAAKASGTAVAATDLALVVGISPNTPARVIGNAADGVWLTPALKLVNQGVLQAGIDEYNQVRSVSVRQNAGLTSIMMQNPPVERQLDSVIALLMDIRELLMLQLKDGLNFNPADIK